MRLSRAGSSSLGDPTVIRYTPLAGLALVVALWCPAEAGESADPAVAAEPTESPDRTALARDEAAAQAFHTLYRRFGQLKLTPDSRVADFLASSADVRAFAWDAVRRRADTGRPRIYSDGVVTVQVHIPIEQVIAQLKSVCSTYCAGQKFQPQDFDKILLYIDRRGLWALGQSRGELRLAIAGSAPVGWYDVGVFGRLRTRRKATDNAHRQLLQRIRDLRFSPSRRLAAFLDSDQRVAADTATFIHSHPNVGDVRYLSQRICEVDVTMAVADLVAELKSLANAYHAGAEFPQEVFDGVSLFVKDPVVKVTGVAVPEVPEQREPPVPADDVWTHAAQAEPPEHVDDASQAHLLATRSALARCREHLRSRLLNDPLPATQDTSDDAGNGGAQGRKTVVDLVDAVPALRKDLNMLLGDLRLVQTRDLTGGRVKVTAELPLARFKALVRHYCSKQARADTPD